MTEAARTQDLFLETLGLWTEANQRLLGDLVELSASTARESVRLYAEMQRTTMGALRETQSAAQRWQAGWKDAAGDPATLYRSAFTEAVHGAQQAFKVAGEHAQSLGRTVERLQASTGQAGKSMQDTLTGTATRMREIYTTS